MFGPGDKPVFHCTNNGFLNFFSVSKTNTFCIMHLISRLKMDFKKLLILKKYMEILELVSMTYRLIKKKIIDFIGSCARQYLTFDNVANFNAMLYALSSFTLTKRIRGFISCFLLGLNEAVNFKSFVGGFL